MKRDTVSSKEHISLLGKELADYHNDDRFLSLKTMGDILTLHLELKLGVNIF